MIRHLKHREIDKKRWDDCIEKSFNGNIYAWSWYHDIVHPQWNALVENDYERVMPLTSNTKFGITYLFQPFFVQQLGVFSQTHLSQENVERFIDSIPDNYKFIEIRLNSFNKVNYELDCFRKHRNIELDLISDYQSIYNSYNKNTKRNLAKAQNSGLILSRDIDAETVIKLFRENRGKNISHWKDKEYQRLLDLIYNAIHKDACFICGAKTNDNQTIAAGVFMYSHDRITFLFSGSDDSHKDKHALTLILDSVIRYFSETQNTFDFEGSDNEGLARYYMGFGARELYYPEIKYNNLNKLLKFATQILGK